MDPSLSRWLCFGAALAACGAGCAPAAERTFAVVLEEPPELDCVPTLGSANINLQDFFDALIVTPATWRAEYASGLLRPTGGVLRVVRADGDAGLAWFDSFPQGPYYQWNGLVFRGDPHDDYVDATTKITHNPDAADPHHLVPDCGELTDVEDDLVATIEGSTLDGRIRRVDITYFPDGKWPCAARVACARNIRLTGAEEP